MPETVADSGSSSAVLLLSDGTSSLWMASNSEIQRGEQIRKLIGETLEIITLDDGVFMFIDEEGKQNGRAVNAAATLLAAGKIFHGDVIVGPAVIVGNPGLTKDWLERLGVL